MYSLFMEVSSWIITNQSPLGLKSDAILFLWLDDILYRPSDEKVIFKLFKQSLIYKRRQLSSRPLTINCWVTRSQSITMHATFGFSLPFIWWFPWLTSSVKWNAMQFSMLFTIPSSLKLLRERENHCFLSSISLQSTIIF